MGRGGDPSVGMAWRRWAGQGKQRHEARWERESRGADFTHNDWWGGLETWCGYPLRPLGLDETLLAVVVPSERCSVDVRGA